ncbi:SIS domain-containing protein [Fredinandcohnia onubensis]|uniref:SIS domain-containing protein n=1 Tax=Fredinandcohnia onubensis TaxID=1571209 RepID=UPI000C0BC551|nr:SIS domain-containing protein [Fredinandcohnia onubensis]
MFELKESELSIIGAAITTREIKQQPQLWEETFQTYKEHQLDISSFLLNISDRHERIRIIFTGAGTSAYVGDTVTPYLKEKLDENKWDLMSIPTTTLVSNPYQYFKKDIPTLLISFARSGNSPESLAAVELAKNMVKDLYQITITCASEGKLALNAEGDESNFLLLMPSNSNDQGFAMTGSYTCMTLAALLVLDPQATEVKEGYVSTICKMGSSVVEREEDIQRYVDADVSRIVYLGSGSLEGLAREAQLKVLELTAGQIATGFDSSLGYRHGPKSFVHEKSNIFVFVSNHPYTRKYDLDMLHELKEDAVAKHVCSIEITGEVNFNGESFQFSEEAQSIPDAYIALPYVMFAQTISLLFSVKVGNKPDTPSPTGIVNRVVKGVTIHSYE